MPVLHVSVYRFAAHGDSGAGALPMPVVPSLAEWQVPIGVDSTQSEVFPSYARFIMIKPETACCVAFGDDPVAKVGVQPIEANERVWFGIYEGHKLAVIDNG